MDSLNLALLTDGLRAEREQNITDISNMTPAATPLQDAMDVLSTPVAPNADVVLTQAELAAQRMHATLDRTNDSAAALARFVDTLSAEDEKALRRLLGRLDRRR